MKVIGRYFIIKFFDLLKISILIIMQEGYRCVHELFLPGRIIRGKDKGEEVADTRQGIDDVLLDAEWWWFLGFLAPSSCCLGRCRSRFGLWFSLWRWHIVSVQG